MSVATQYPTMALAAGEAALPIDTKAIGALAQVSGAAIGFDVFTPAASGLYRVFVRGQDVATGDATHGWLDELVVYKPAGGGGVVTITTLHSTDFVGTPGARTWSNNMGALKVAVATGATWYVDVVLIRFPT